MKQFFLVCLAAVTLVGCGNDRDDPAPPPIDADFVSGAVHAPGGTVALLEHTPALRYAVNWLIPAAHADLTGILPVAGATVELLRIDNTGAPLGDVIATATTTTSGGFTLIFPQGETIAKTGDLIVRVSGGGQEMRGQIIGSRADVNPYTEYLLQRFIDDGYDLATLESNDIANILRFIESYELPVGNDLTTTLADLDAAVGALVDKQFEIVDSSPGDSAALEGNFRVTEFRWALLDDDDLGLETTGQLNYSTWASAFDLSDQEDGFLFFSPVSQGLATAQLNNNPAIEYTLNFSNAVTGQSGNNGVYFSDANILYTEAPFSQSVNGDLLRKTQPALPQFQASLNNDLLIALGSVDSVNYRFQDDDDDVIDPPIRAGDQSSRGILIASKKPEEATNADLVGNFGRIHLSMFLSDDGEVSVSTERNILAFDGIDSFNSQAGDIQSLERDGLGGSSYSTSALAEELAIAYELDEDGDVTIGAAEDPSAYVNHTFDWFAATETTSTDDDDEEDTVFVDAQLDKSFALKLPNALLTLTDRVYRVVYVGFGLDGDAISLNHSLLDTYLTATTETTGLLNGALATVTQATRDGELQNAQATLSDAPAAITLAADGSLTITYADGGGDLVLDGFINHDGSVGVLSASYTPTGLDPTILGMAVLVEVNN